MIFLSGHRFLSCLTVFSHWNNPCLWSQFPCPPCPGLWEALGGLRAPCLCSESKPGEKQGALGLLIINIFNYFRKLFTLLAAIIAAKSLYGASVAGGDLEWAWVCSGAWQAFLTSRDNDRQPGKTRNINRFSEGCVSRVKTEKASAVVRKEQKWGWFVVPGSCFVLVCSLLFILFS